MIIGTRREDTPRTWPPGVVMRTDVPHQQVMDAWQHARIGLVPSLWPEGFGLVAVEAMRSGVPVVASRIGALPGIVADGITGILVAPGNTTELLAAIRRSTTTRRFAAQWGRQGCSKRTSLAPRNSNEAVRATLSSAAIEAT